LKGSILCVPRRDCIEAQLGGEVRNVASWLPWELTRAAIVNSQRTEPCISSEPGQATFSHICPMKMFLSQCDLGSKFLCIISNKIINFKDDAN